MPLAPDDLAWVRSNIGDDTPPEDGDLDAIYDRVGTVAGVAAEVLRKRLADLLAGPASFSVDGYSQNVGANINALMKQLAELDELAGTDTLTQSVRIIALSRQAPRR